MMLRIFIGYDERQPLACNVLAHSIVRHASRPVAITPLVLQQLSVKRQGLTAFTYSRYLVPHLCKYQGQAIFMDADIVVTGDIYELDAICRPQIAPVCVSKNKLRFEWPSVMYFNCAHAQALTPKVIEEGEPQKLAWAHTVGEFPGEWNFLVGYDAPTDATPKAIHYTQGIPCWPETKDCAYASVWQAEAQAAGASCGWQELMGQSVHARPVMERLASQAAV